MFYLITLKIIQKNINLGLINKTIISCLNDNKNYKKFMLKKNTIIVIDDDGSGFDENIISSLGQPYISSDKVKQNIQGMGLGIFISKNLLERCSAKVDFSNKKNAGAMIAIEWTNSQLANL